METLQIDHAATSHPIDHPTGIEGLSIDIFATLSAMRGGCPDLPSRDEIESKLSNLDLFTGLEYKHLLEFINLFFRRIASIVAESVLRYLDNPGSDGSLEFFFHSVTNELKKARNSYYDASPFESLLARYRFAIDREEIL